MYLEFTSHTQYLELRTTIMDYWYNVENDEYYLKDVTQHNYKIITSTF